MKKSIIIIGSGIAGLSAGCYGQMNGFKTKIFEMHNLPGGLCTSWKRKGYTFDGCLHWLVGSGEASPFYKIWQELGATQMEVIDYSEFTRIEGPENKTMIVYTNIDKFESHLKELAPEDESVICELADAVRELCLFKQPLKKAKELYNLLDEASLLLKILPHAKIFSKYRNVKVIDFVKQFQNDFLKDAFSRIFTPEFPMLALLFTLAGLNNKSSGFPKGGSLAFAKTLERHYIELGGTVQYKSRVDKILIKNGKAEGIRLIDGTEYMADIVISAADGYATIFKMLEGNYINKQIKDYYDHLPIFEPLIQVSLGIHRDLSDIPHNIRHWLNQPISIAGKELNSMTVRHYCFDSSLAPAGKSVVITNFQSDYAYWEKFKEDREAYEAEKKKIADTYINEINKIYPGLKEDIEVIDVATPLTYKRYTDNWQGSFEGWLITTKTLGMSMNKTLPGLENFFMIGQWVEPGGGVPTAALSGRDVIQIICKKENK
ncbi:NAD(P)/FAD-dependent oxidoreductase [Neobacillus sp. PS3-12]|uniref:phytoene desaturase family protein n=1 Tax=Neobacillus sp. PS3-12 TaxID=3070677 RepID=UPI0027DEB616|nr:NAD(P)/FAD-dependent oxidoreductase [Neobacillus sp. PS3-12]WML52207.1 NAD(P)/FAD-dependent oxidoreductase [Neobacillus sp. PS3-12]